MASSANGSAPAGSVTETVPASHLLRVHRYQKSIGRDRAVALAETKWWLTRLPREIAKFQLFTVELCMPFEVFHRALEQTLARPVWIHEFGFSAEALAEELLGERDAPSLEEILALIPEEKRQPVLVEDAFE
jgi:hypothetical protein